MEQASKFSILLFFEKAKLVIYICQMNVNIL